MVLALARGPLGFERTVVLKRLLGDAADTDGAARLAREALAYARLSHPAIVRLYDFVEDGGNLALVLEHVDGTSLARLVGVLRSRGEPLPVPCSLYVGYRIFLALAAAHAARDPVTREFAPVIHRNVSPENVLVPWDGFVKLGDFGGARLAGVAGDTRPGVAKGTLGYMAPEQVRGEPISVRADVYAACLVVRELVTGEPAFPREGRSEMQVLAAMASPELDPVEVVAPGLPPHVRFALDRGLARDPEARTLGADEIAAVLRTAIDVEAARERLVSQVGRLRRGGSARSVGFATVPDVGASLFDESSPAPDTDADATPPRDAQKAVTSRPPPERASAPEHLARVSMVVPLSTPRVGIPAAPAPRALEPGLPPPAPAAPAPVPLPFAASAPLVVETPLAGGDVTARPTRAPWRPGVLAVAAVAAAISGGLFGAILALREPGASPGSARTAVAVEPDPPVAVRPPEPPASAPVVELPAAAPLVRPPPPPARTDAPSAAPVPPGKGRLLTEAREEGHRVFVDGRFAGAGGAPILVRCGRRQVRVGSAGRLRTVEVPCGGEVLVHR